MSDDPRVRSDGRCYVCGGERRSEPRKIAAELAADPFCSTGCAKLFHGVAISSGVAAPTGRKKRY